MMRKLIVYVLFILFFALHAAARAENLGPGYHFLSGRVEVKEPIVVPEGSELYVAPGTEIYVSLANRDAYEDVPQVLVVEGKLVLDGRPDNPIKITGEKDWGEISVKGATAVVRYTEVSNASWAFHVHQSTALFERLKVRDSYGGIRSNGEGIYVYDSEITGCEIAMRYLNGGPVVRRSVLTGNRVGIFFREGISTARFRENIVESTEYVLKIGDFATGFVDVRENYWGVSDLRLLKEKVFDGRDEPFDWSIFEPILVSPPSRD